MFWGMLRSQFSTALQLLIDYLLLQDLWRCVFPWMENAKQIYKFLPELLEKNVVWLTADKTFNRLVLSNTDIFKQAPQRWLTKFITKLVTQTHP